jgi:catalase
MENGNGRGIATLRVAVLVAPGVEVGALRAVQQALEEGRARCTLLADRIGSVATAQGQQLMVDETWCSSASVLFDAVLVPGGAPSVDALAANGHAMHFIAEAFRHGKSICVIGDSLRLLEPLGIGDAQAAAAVPGVVVGRNDPPSRAQLAQEFVAALACHRHWGRAQLDRVRA